MVFAPFPSLKKYRSIILLGLSLVLFACHGLLEEATARSSYIDCVATLFVLMLFLSISYEVNKFSILGCVLGVVALSVIWLDDIFPSYAHTFRLIEDLSLWFLIGGFIANGIKTLICAESISHDHLSAAFALYLLLGIWWGFLYDFIWIIDSSAFIADKVTHLTLGDFFQFSLSTITTVSTSVISAHTPLIRCLNTLEAVCGQFYFAMLIGGLVGSHFNYRNRQRAE